MREAICVEHDLAWQIDELQQLARACGLDFDAKLVSIPRGESNDVWSPVLVHVFIPSLAWVRLFVLLVGLGLNYGHVALRRATKGKNKRKVERQGSAHGLTSVFVESVNFINSVPTIPSKVAAEAEWSMRASPKRLDELCRRVLRAARRACLRLHRCHRTARQSNDTTHDSS